MTFPNVVATTVPVHPTPLYEVLAAVGIAAALWALGRRCKPVAVFGAYLVLSGTARFLVEIVRVNDPDLLGLTQPQLWSFVSVLAGAVLLARTRPIHVTADRSPGAPHRRSHLPETANA